MSRYCDLVGHEIAKEILRDSIVKALFVPALRPVFSAIMQTAVELAGGDPDDDTSAYATLEQVLAPPGTAVAAFDPVDFYTLPFDEDPAAFNENQAQLAQWIARIFGPLARSAMTTSSVDDTPVSDPPQPRQPVPEGFGDSMTVLNSNPDTANVAEDLRREGIFDSADAASHTSVAMGAVVAPGAFVDFVRGLGDYLARLCPQLAWLPAAIVTEVATTTARAAVAEAMTQAALTIPLQINSSLQIGTYVHRTLQRRYEGRRSAFADVVSERWNPIINRPDQVVVGPTTGGSPLPLSDVARSPVMDTDWFFRCLHMSLASPRLDRETWLRADLIDRERLEIWEIKPVMSAQSGVWQEAIYRNSFNLVRALLDCLGIRPLTGPLSAGGSLLLPGTSRAGILTSTYSVLNPIDVTSQAGMPAVAIPYQVIVLPGLLPYVVFRSPNQGEILAVLSVLIARALLEAQRQAQRLARELAAATGRAIEQAARAISDWATPENIVIAIVVVVIVIILVIAIVASGGLAGLGAGGAGAGAGAGGAGAGAAGGAGLSAGMAEAFAALMAMLRGLAPAVRLSPGMATGGLLLNISPTTPPASSSEERPTIPETTAINIQGLTIHGLPTEAIGALLTGVGLSLNDALGMVSRHLRNPTRPPVAVA